MKLRDCLYGLALLSPPYSKQQRQQWQLERLAFPPPKLDRRNKPILPCSCIVYCDGVVAVAAVFATHCCLLPMFARKRKNHNDFFFLLLSHALCQNACMEFIHNILCRKAWQGAAFFPKNSYKVGSMCVGTAERELGITIV